MAMRGLGDGEDWTTGQVGRGGEFWVCLSRTEGGREAGIAASHSPEAAKHRLEAESSWRCPGKN